MVLRQLLTTSRVGQLAPKAVPVLRGDQTISEAVCAMRAHSHGSAMVCRDGKLIGIFTERDLMKHLAAGKALDQPVASVMTAEPRTVALDDALMTVIQLMDEGGYRRLPVVNSSGSPIGIVDVKSVVHFLVEHFPESCAHLAPVPCWCERSRRGHIIDAPPPVKPPILPRQTIGCLDASAVRHAQFAPPEEGVDFRMSSTEVLESQPAKKLEQLDGVVIRFCGDSGDGMQLVGTQFTNVSAALGNDVSALYNTVFPAEIRAPVGTLAGVSGFQLHFSSSDIFTPGDEVDTLVAMNPAALKTNLEGTVRAPGERNALSSMKDMSVRARGNLQKAGYETNPLETADVIARYTVHRVPMTRLTRDAVSGLGLSRRKRRRPLQEFFRSGSGLLALRPRPQTD